MTSPVILKNPEWMRRFSRQQRGGGRRIAFVPTMGYLHDGHLRLVQEACSRADCVVVSIFVNPIQFGPHEDLDRYPRDLDGDLRKLSAYPVDAVFYPDAADMYPEGFQTRVRVERVASGLCGASRPGHFDGVATVVLKLLHIVEPDIAVFGLKDYQQFQVIRTMVRDLNMNIELVGVDTVREPDGLAMSSRNVYLSPEERAAAVVLSRSLEQARQAIREGRISTGVEAERFLHAAISAEPLARVDYAACRDAATLEPVERIAGDVVLAVAVFFGSTRLIDNCVVAF